MTIEIKVQSNSLKTIASRLAKCAIDHQHPKLSLIALNILDDAERGLDLDEPCDLRVAQLLDSLDYLTKMQRDDVRKLAKGKPDTIHVHVADRWLEFSQLIADVTEKLKEFAVAYERDAEAA
jgi:hypothetical protein